jgi:GNAT superfamily N-acetyltransferase
MSTAKIYPVGPEEIGLVAQLYNQVFNPRVDPEFFRRRYSGRRNVCQMVAELDKNPVGFIIGFELTPATYICWLCGVLPDFRRLRIATQLIQAQHSWARDHSYEIMRFECLNQHRPMLHVAITEGYDLVGIRWDTASGNNVVIFEKDLR